MDIFNVFGWIMAILVWNGMGKLKNMLGSVKNLAKKDLGVAQVVDHLPSKVKAMSSNPLIKKKTEKNIRENMEQLEFSYMLRILIN
jgi:hypothetical protein